MKAHLIDYLESIREEQVAVEQEEEQRKCIFNLDILLRVWGVKSPVERTEIISILLKLQRKMNFFYEDAHGELCGFTVGRAAENYTVPGLNVVYITGLLSLISFLKLI